MVPTDQKVVWGPEPGGIGTRPVQPVAVTIIPAPNGSSTKIGKRKTRSAEVWGVSLRKCNLCFKLAAHTAAPKANHQQLSLSSNTAVH